MSTDVKIPELGESVSEGVIGQWLVNDGDIVDADQIVLELETDKAAMEIPAGASGQITLVAAKGDTVSVGDTVARIEPTSAVDSGKGPAGNDAGQPEPTPSSSGQTPARPSGADPVDIKVPELGESVSEGTIGRWLKADGDYVDSDDIVLELETDKAAMEIPAGTSGLLKISKQAGEVAKVGDVVGHVVPADQPAGAGSKEVARADEGQAGSEAGGAAGSNDGSSGQQTLSPAVRRLVEQHNVDPGSLQGSGPGGRILKKDVLDAVGSQSAGDSKSESTGATRQASDPKSTRPAAPATAASTRPRQERVEMSSLRKRIAQRLVEAQQTAAILTTFNEIDMSALKDLRARYRDEFERKHGVRLGFMSLFGRACVQALLEIPEVNARIEGDEVVYNHFVNLGIAVGSKRGLVVPVVKDADQMSIAQLESAIGELAGRARDGKITPDDLSGGTFTISNGGVYGSLLSTPILNPPQTGILGMHKIEDRPVVVDGEIVIRPMMYVALSYDHRLIDGEQAVTFLVKVKNYLEDPARLLLDI